MTHQNNTADNAAVEQKSNTDAIAMIVKTVSTSFSADKYLGLSTLNRDLDKARSLAWEIAAGNDVIGNAEKLAEILLRGDDNAIGLGKQLFAALGKSIPDVPKSSTARKNADMSESSANSHPKAVMPQDPPIPGGSPTLSKSTGCDGEVVVGHKGRKKPAVGTKAEPPSTTTPAPALDLKMPLLPIVTGTPTTGLKLFDLLPSRWNRAFGMDPDAKYVLSLSDDIKLHGLIHRITLIRDKDGSLKVLAGWNRVLALRSIRGLDGCLQPDEYIILETLTEQDTECVGFSIAENALRRESSPYELGCYIRRLTTHEAITQEQVGTMLGLNRVTVNALVKLAGLFTCLPDSWQRDLRCNSNYIPRIGRSHWNLIAGTIVKSGTSEELNTLMEKAHAEGWSVRQLDNALGNLRKRKTGKHSLDTEPQTMLPAGSDSPPQNVAVDNSEHGQPTGTPTTEKHAGDQAAASIAGNRQSDFHNAAEHQQIVSDLIRPHDASLAKCADALCLEIERVSTLTGSEPSNIEGGANA